MEKEKNPVHKVQINDRRKKETSFVSFSRRMTLESSQNIKDAMKDLLGGIIKEMLEVEIDNMASKLETGFGKLKIMFGRCRPE